MELLPAATLSTETVKRPARTEEAVEESPFSQENTAICEWHRFHDRGQDGKPTIGVTANGAIEARG